MGALKNETVNLRMDAPTRELIARAAAASGKSLTGFMTDAALGAARTTLLDQRFISVSAEVFEEIETLLSDRSPPNPALQKLMKSTRSWSD